MPIDQFNQQLRQQLRQRRRALSPLAQTHTAKALVQHFCHHPRFIRSQYLAVYLATDGELSLKYLIQAAWQMGKTCYLPVLQAYKPSLWFLPYDADTCLYPNRYDILEPRYQSRLVRPPWALDLVLTPLVGFDASGQRLGMGGGFYDRRFAYLQTQKHNSLVGVAHSCQQVKSLPQQAWDIPMQAILTETDYKIPTI